MWGWRTGLADPRRRGRKSEKSKKSISAGTGPLISGVGSLEAEFSGCNAFFRAFRLLICTFLLNNSLKRGRLPISPASSFSAYNAAADASPARNLNRVHRERAQTTLEVQRIACRFCRANELGVSAAQKHGLPGADSESCDLCPPQAAESPLRT